MDIEATRQPVAFAPEITLIQARPEATLEWFERSHDSPPFWAIAWPGGQAMARYLLDHPEEAQGKCVIDYGSGSGLAAIAAAKAGAARVTAVDIDPAAREAIRKNAEQNGVTIGIEENVNLDKPVKADLILAADVCYDQIVAARALRWLYICVDEGKRVLLADPGRAYVPTSGLREMAKYHVPTRRAFEDTEWRLTRVWELGLPEVEE